MNAYSTYWRTTIFASIALHFLLALGLMYVLPHLIPEPTFNDVSEFEWIDVDMTEDVVVVEAEAIPIEEIIPTDEPEPSLFDANDLIIPDLPMPEPIELKPVEPPPPPPPLEVKPIERPQPKLVESKPVEKAEPESEPPKEEVVVPKNSKQQLGEPPVTLTEVYPEPGSGLGYKGYVSIAATIGKDGTVKATKVMRTSGRMVVDRIAQNAAMKWTFKPALDQEGKPMECDKIITFDFKKFA